MDSLQNNKNTSYTDIIRNKCVLLLNKELNNEIKSRQIEKSIFKNTIK